MCQHTEQIDASLSSTKSLFHVSKRVSSCAHAVRVELEAIAWRDGLSLSCSSLIMASFPRIAHLAGVKNEEFCDHT
jgi:hypothetical protein